jgi:hypothetical protein
MHAHAEAHGAPRGARTPPQLRQDLAILTALLVVSVTGPMLGIRVVTLITAFGIAW